MTDSPYLFPAAEHPLQDATDRLKVREAVSGFGIALRYQERAPDLAGTPESDWCETGHSIFILSGRIRYRFDTHAVEAGPGDMLHIPAGPEHRHKPSVPGPEIVRYVLTGTPESDWCETGHSIFILSGRIRYRFDTHAVEAGPGDMLHIPAGPEHRHKPSVPGPEIVRYVLTEFE